MGLFLLIICTICTIYNKYIYYDVAGCFSLPGIFPGQNVQNGAVNRGLRFPVGAERWAGTWLGKTVNRDGILPDDVLIAGCAESSLFSVNSALCLRNGPERRRNGPNLGFCAEGDEIPIQAQNAPERPENAVKRRKHFFERQKAQNGRIFPPQVG